MDDCYRHGWNDSNETLEGLQSFIRINKQYDIQEREREGTHLKLILEVANFNWG